MPKYTTDALASSGTSMMRRKVVLREVCTPKRAAKRTPPLPQVARPIEVMCSLSLVVIRAHGSVSFLRRSVKTDAANSRDCGKRIYAPSEKAEAGVRHTQRLSKFDGSSYGCETKAVNRADNWTEDGLRSLRLPDRPPRCGIWSISIPSGRERSVASFMLSFLDCISPTYEVPSYERI